MDWQNHPCTPLRNFSALLHPRRFVSSYMFDARKLGNKIFDKKGLRARLYETL